MSSINGLGSSIDPALLQFLQPADDTIGGAAIDPAATDSIANAGTANAAQPASTTSPAAAPLTGVQQSLVDSGTQSALIEIQATLTTATSASTSAPAPSAGSENVGVTDSTSSFRSAIQGLAKLLGQLTGQQPAGGAAAVASDGSAEADAGGGSSGGGGSSAGGGSSGTSSASATPVSTAVTYNPDGTITTTVINSDGTETVTVTGSSNEDQPGTDSSAGLT